MLWDAGYYLGDPEERGKRDGGTEPPQLGLFSLSGLTQFTAEHWPGFAWATGLLHLRLIFLLLIVYHTLEKQEEVPEE